MHFEGVEVGCQVRVHHSLQEGLQDACDACTAQQLHLHSILEAGLSLFTLQQALRVHELAVGALAFTEFRRVCMAKLWLLEIAAACQGVPNLLQHRATSMLSGATTAAQANLRALSS